MWRKRSPTGWVTTSRGCPRTWASTIFACRKLSFVDLLAAICLFVNAAKGASALQLSRDLDVQYKTAFVLAHKLREALADFWAGRPRDEADCPLDRLALGLERWTSPEQSRILRALAEARATSRCARRPGTPCPSA